MNALLEAFVQGYLDRRGKFGACPRERFPAAGAGAV